jgi:cyclic-di-GMP phosphodiesterase TipF (flagellum assembly factor)
VAAHLDEGEVLEAVRDGLKADRVDLYLQPIVELPQRKRRYFECFSRIRTSESETVVPNQYIAMAEREGLISAIDNMLLFRCVQLIRKTRQRRYRVGFFCNIAPHTLIDTKFFSEFVQFMTANEELSSSLVFEFAQADRLDQEMPVIEELDRLASHGFRYSVDQVTDFNVRPARLASRHVGFVKLDAEATMVKIREEGLDLGALRRSSEAHDIEVIVEKVESENDLVELLDFGIEYGQGFLFGEPRLSRDP